MYIFPLLVMGVLFFSEKKSVMGFVERIFYGIYWGLFSGIISIYLCQLRVSSFDIFDFLQFTQNKESTYVYFIFFMMTFLVILSVHTFNKKFSNIDIVYAKISKLERVIISIFYICLFGAIFFISSANWAMNHFKGVSINQIIYTLLQPLAGTDQSQISSYITGPILQSIFYTLLIILMFYLLNYGIRLKKKQHFIKYFPFRKITLTILSVLILVGGLLISVNEIGYAEVKAYFFEKSKVYEKNYIDPSKVKVTFPTQKRNLIYIFMESLESTYISKDLGGGENVNLLPNLSRMIQNGEALNFSNSDKIGGALTIQETAFTAGGMVAQTSGVSLKTSIKKSDMNANAFAADLKTFLPGAYSIGEILEKNGYKNYLLMGSDARFAGRSTYFQQHGNYEIVDYYSALKNDWIPKGYKVWWGYEDKKLYDNAKTMLTSEIDTTKPFNLTLLTADTHFEDGYMSAETPKLYDDQYSNVIHYADQLVFDFISWLKQQPFYENTTIVISGDHLSMDKDFFDNLDVDYERTVFNTIINAPITPVNTKNRKFSTFDMYPTTLAALNAQIEGNQLGLGVNLFSNEPTIPEKIGYKNFDSEISKRSDYYEKVILNKK